MDVSEVVVLDPPFQSELEQFALRQHEVNQRLAVAQAMRDHFFKLYVKPYDDEMEALRSELKDADAQLRANIMAYYKQTGDKDMSPHVTVREVSEWEYDEDIMAAEALKHAPELLRLSLKKTDFKALLNGGTAPAWVKAQKVTFAQLAIGKLGDLVIKHEVDQLRDQLRKGGA